MQEIKIKKGDVVYCVHRKALEGGTTPGVPIKGIIISITTKLNRQIAVELDEKITTAHDCDGLGKNKQCLWCRPWHILTPVEWEKLEKTKKIAAKTIKESVEIDELVLRNIN